MLMSQKISVMRSKPRFSCSLDCHLRFVSDQWESLLERPSVLIWALPLSFPGKRCFWCHNWTAGWDCVGFRVLWSQMHSSGRWCVAFFCLHKLNLQSLAVTLNCNITPAQPSRNEKFLSCIASGKWVLHKAFVEASKNNGGFVQVSQLISPRVIAYAYALSLSICFHLFSAGNWPWVGGPWNISADCQLAPQHGKIGPCCSPMEEGFAAGEEFRNLMPSIS